MRSTPVSSPLLPGESQALRRKVSTAPRRWVAYALLTIITVTGPAVVFSLTGGHLGHLLGETTETTGHVTAVHVDGYCSRGHRAVPTRKDPNYRVEVSWTLGADSGHGEYTTCQVTPSVGETIRVWVNPTNGLMRAISPHDDRAGLIAFSVVLTGIAWNFAGRSVSLHRRRRRLLAIDVPYLTNAVPVDVRTDTRTRMRTPASRWRIRVRRVVYFDSVLAPTPTHPERRLLKGDWQLHLTPDDGRRRRLGLLVRGRERCWIDLPAHRFR